MEEFEQLKKQFEPMIHKIIQSLNIYKNQSEFYQTGLIALWEAQERFDPEKGHFVSFAYTYIRGRMLTEMKRSSRLEHRNVYPKEEFWEMIQDDDADPMLNANEFILSLVEGCHLTGQQKKWVMYTCVHMLSVSEIAEIEGVSVSAVKQWRKGAKEKLKDSLIEIID
ncbi:DNA-directed RNA polymerase [Bacillus oleivorans]|uniref:DNA-directed RNA polymerase n=1 Tax=Bacillus oleivorans TaxID=1448271 RepID=A0A285CHN3_9BACI|nr:sigma-70 family RNA polymerase sigma factor [Bacillus oleivorans]SNX67112.1 DNA-directed RNA polymerase [Bacillus oleivorans]